MKRTFPGKYSRATYFALMLAILVYLVGIPDLSIIFNVPLKTNPLAFKPSSYTAGTAFSFYPPVSVSRIRSSARTSQNVPGGKIVCLECQNIPVMHKDEDCIS